MLRLSIALTLIVLTFGWLISRRLDNLSKSSKIIFLGLIGVVFFRPIVGESFFLAPQLFFEILIFFISFLLLSYKLINKSESIYISVLDKAFCIFILFMCISACFSVNKGSSISSIIYFFSLYLCFWITANLSENHKIKNIIWQASVLGCFLIVLYALYQYFYGFNLMRAFLDKHPELLIQSREFMRRMQSNVVFSTFIYPPMLAGYLTLMFFILLGLSFQSVQRAQKNIFAIFKNQFIFLVLFLIIPVILLTKSKAGWLILLGGMIAFIALTENKKKVIPRLVICFLCFFICLFIIAHNRQMRLPKIDNLFASLGVRLEYWKATGAMISTRPILGFGPGTFGSVYPLFKTKFGEETIMAHNSFLQLIAEGGIVCFLPFFLFWTMVVFYGYRLIRANASASLTGIYIGIIAYLVHNFFDFSLYVGQVSVMVFIFMGTFFLKGREMLFLRINISSNLKRMGLFFSFFVLFSLLSSYTLFLYSAKRYDMLAAEALKHKDYKKALQFSEKSVIFNPLSDLLFYHRAIIMEKIALDYKTPAKLREFFRHKSIKNYKLAIERDSLSANYNFRLANLLLLFDNTEYLKQVRLYLERAAQLYPVNPFYHEQLGKFYAIIGEHKLAEKEKELAAELAKYYKKGTL